MALQSVQEKLEGNDLKSLIENLSGVMPKSADGLMVVVDGLKDYDAKRASVESINGLRKGVDELLTCWFDDYFSPEYLKLKDKDKDKGQASKVVREIAGFMAEDEVFWMFFSSFFKRKFQISFSEVDLPSEVLNEEKGESTDLKKKCLYPNKLVSRGRIHEFLRACGFWLDTSTGKGAHSGVRDSQGKLIGTDPGHGETRIKGVIDELIEKGISLDVIQAGYNRVFGGGFVILQN